MDAIVILMQSGNPSLVPRVSALLRALSTAEGGDASTTELARSTGLARPTVHRLLSSLAAEGMVDRTVRTGRWLLGPELYLWGAVAAGRYEVTDIARDIVHHLAVESGESAFLSMRRADQTVCLVREDGSFPLRSHVLYEGIRLPLGVASAGLAILAHLPDREVESYLASVDLTSQWGAAHRADEIRSRVRQTRVTGYAVNPALLVEGSWGIGAAVFDAQERPAWTLSLTGVETRFRDDRRATLGALLLDQAHRLTGRLRRRR